VDALLTTADARAADDRGATWRVDTITEPVLLDPCPGGTAYPRDVDRTDRASAALVSDEEGGATALQQQVARYRSEATARDAFEGYSRAVAACPTRTDGTMTVRHELVGRERRGGVDTLLVRWSSSDDQPDAAVLCCFEYYAVQLMADAVSVLVAGSGGDGDPQVDLLEPFAEAAGIRLARTAG